MAIFETHCHLNHELFDSDVELVLDRAFLANVNRLLVVSYDLASSRRAVELARQSDRICAAVGIHPEDAGEWNSATATTLVDLVRNNAATVCAWGEIGLDYHWKTFEPDLQKAVFREQLGMAQSLDLPAIIHCRDAYDDTLDLLEQESTVHAVLHCFTGTVEQALRATSLGFYIGIGGIVTYKSAHEVRAVAQAVPRDRLLLETDSPYLAPQPWRGNRNEPSFLTAIAERLAEALGCPQDEVEDATWHNAVCLFDQSSMR